MQWVPLTTAPDQTTAESWVELLWDQAIEAKLDPGDVTSYLGVSSRPCRLLVSAADAERARAAMRDLGLPSE